jgi:LuxR family maltose regulon positive regulatory protein
LVELRAEQLRFTVDEAADLLNGTLELSLPPNDVQRLVQRTEGWAAGLQLAALRLTDRADRSRFIERFTGADRHVVDYLGEEVLANQPKHIKDFLLQTAVLNRMCASLCDAVTERHDSAELLDQIYRANLFLTPLDDAQVWFRYHHLFRGILRHELVRAHPQQSPVLHRRAAQWYTAAGDLAEAIGHASESGDTELAAGLVMRAWRQHFNAGQLHTVQRWLDALPAHVVASNVQLSVARIWLAMDAGGLDDAAAALRAAEQGTAPDVHLQLLRALHTYKTGDVGTAARLLRAIDRPPDEPFLATVRGLLNGVCALWLGSAEKSAAWLRAAAATAQRDENRLARIYALGCLGLLAVEDGDLAAGASLVHDADDEVRTTLSDAHFVAMFPALAHARLAAAQADWPVALTKAKAAVRLAQRGAGRVELGAALLTAAVISRRSVDPVEAEHDALPWPTQARAVIRECADPGPVLRGWLDAEQRATAFATQSTDLAKPLTEREQAILRLLPRPISQRQLANTLFVTPNTLKTHLRAIYRKLGVTSRDKAIIRAHELSLL